VKSAAAVGQRPLSRARWRTLLQATRLAVGPRQKDGDTLDVFKRLGEASLMLGGLFYLVGWSYLQAYYAAFGFRVDTPCTYASCTTASSACSARRRGCSSDGK
jgi:hypothetical protein